MMLIKKLSAKTLALLLAFVMVFGTVSVMASEAGNGFELPDVDFEIAFLLDADLVMDDDGGLCDEFLYAIGLEVNRYRRLYIQWMDTADQYFNSDGWINRIRQRNWEDRWQLTYRRRYPIAWPVTYANIEAAFAQAIEDGFNLEDWEFEIDWSYNSAVLSLSDTVNIPFPEGVERGMLPDVELSRELLIDNIPDKFYEMGWYAEALAGVVAHGPVLYRRFEFNRFGSNNAIRIEIMPLRNADGTGTEYIVEVSHATEGLGLEVTEERRDYIYNLFAGYILPRSGLRTSTVLARYQGVNQGPVAEVVEDDYETEDETPALPQETVVRMEVGSAAYTVNGEARTLDVAPFVADDVIMVPLRAVAEALGAQVSWIDETRTITLAVEGAPAVRLIRDDSHVLIEGRALVSTLLLPYLGFTVTVYNGVVYIQK